MHSLHVLYCFLYSQSFNSGTAAASTADDHHDDRVQWGAEGRPEEVNASPSHTLLSKLIGPVANEILSRPGSCQETSGVCPIFAALTPACSLVASSMLGPEE